MFAHLLQQPRGRGQAMVEFGLVALLFVGILFAIVDFGMLLNGWINALRWQRLPEMDRLGEFLFRHIEGIAAYCDHLVRFGVVESINTTIKAVLRRARGMRDEQILLLKLKWTTAHPIRSARDLAAFLTAQPLYSNR